jgi:hypothetical protein
MRRAKWFELALPSNSQLAITLEATPPATRSTTRFDLGMEVFDPSDRPISKSAIDDEDAHELTKEEDAGRPRARQVPRCACSSGPDGHRRKFVLRAAFKPTAAAQLRQLPRRVKFVRAGDGADQDDTPRSYKPRSSRSRAGTAARTRPSRHRPRRRRRRRRPSHAHHQRADRARRRRSPSGAAPGPAAPTA